MILKEKQMEKFKPGDVVYFMYKDKINKGFVEYYIPNRKAYKIRKHLTNVAEYKIYRSIFGVIASLLRRIVNKTA